MSDPYKFNWEPIYRAYLPELASEFIFGYEQPKKKIIEKKEVEVLEEEIKGSDEEIEGSDEEIEGSDEEIEDLSDEELKELLEEEEIEIPKEAEALSFAEKRILAKRCGKLIRNIEIDTITVTKEYDLCA